MSWKNKRSHTRNPYAGMLADPLFAMKVIKKKDKKWTYKDYEREQDE
jgi:hypothetical protein